jgi:galacturan 1,4-alpha-galacturonidase
MLNALSLVSVLSSVAIAATVPLNSLFSRSIDGVNKRATCTPTSAGSANTDDVPAIEAAFKSCGTGGTIVIPAGKTYMIRSTLDFTGCSNCDFQVEGTLKASDDTTFWNGVGAIISVSGITGAKIRSVTGAGVIDGNGQASYDKFASDSSYRRPKLLNIAGKSMNIAVSNLRFKNPPCKSYCLLYFSALGSHKLTAQSSFLHHQQRRQLPCLLRVPVSHRRIQVQQPGQKYRRH